MPLDPQIRSEAKLAGAFLGVGFALVLIMIAMAVFGPRVINAIRALDDGPAHPPSAYERR